MVFLFYGDIQKMMTENILWNTLTPAERRLMRGRCRWHDLGVIEHGRQGQRTGAANVVKFLTPQHVKILRSRSVLPYRLIPPVLDSDWLTPRQLSKACCGF